MTSKSRLKVFISHSFTSKDLTDEFVEKFGTHHYDCEIFYDMTAYAGSFNERLLQKFAGSCDIAILLLSSKFIASDYCNNKELPILKERQKKGEVIIIPVLFQACDFIKWNTEKGGDLTFFQIKKINLYRHCFMDIYYICSSNIALY